MYCVNLATGARMSDREGRPVTHPARSEGVWRTGAMQERRAQVRGLAGPGAAATSGPGHAREVMGYDHETREDRARRFAAEQVAEHRAERAAEVDAAYFSTGAAEERASQDRAASSR